MDIHIGKIIRNHLYNNRISTPAFAKMLAINPKGISRNVLKKQHLHTKLLLEISQLLNHNFFQYYVSDPQQEKKIIEELQQKLLQLQNETAQLKTENNYLKEMYLMMKEKKK